MTVVFRHFVSWCLFTSLCFGTPALAAGSFVNWESPHVHPLDMTPDGTKLLAVHTADNRLLVFDLTGGTPALTATIPVGLEPVSVRARSNTEAWVVNHISDSISIVDLTTHNVVSTLPTEDEPADVVFAGFPQRAFVTCSQVNRVLVVDPTNPLGAPRRVTLRGEEPRALAVSPDGTRVYAAIFESGNGSTVLSGSFTDPNISPPNVVSNPISPYGGVNPPPNDGTTFSPALTPTNPRAPAVGHIVKKDANGRWLDDNKGDWTSLVSGADAPLSGRPVGWNLVDNDVAIIDSATLAVSYIPRLMNLNMALAVHPTGKLSVVGTEALNEIRFEPKANGRFLRVQLALVDPSKPTTPTLRDLNPHLDYRTATVSQALRALSVGDPRGIAWNSAGTRGYVTGMGSNNVAVIDINGSRVAQVTVGEGPTGVVVDNTRSRLYVLNKFASSLSVVGLGTHTELARVPFFDPSPAAIKVGRKHLYDTHKTSGLGHIACASCHVDGRTDRLAWDLGDPSGAMKSPSAQNVGMGLAEFAVTPPEWHPMKGPLTTQTLQDIIGKEPLHWRGDHDGLEEFNGAFMHLQGDDAQLTPAEMQQFKDFLATLTFPPNPFRNIDNTLPTHLPLPGHYTTGKFGPAGQPLPNGNAVNGLAMFRPPRLLFGGQIACATCHTLPVGVATNMRWDGTQYNPLPAGPNGEQHHGLIPNSPITINPIKVPQLRNLYEKVGMDLTQPEALTGFGFTHDGSVDSIARFILEPPFQLQSDQEVADMVAFLLSFSGSDLPKGSTTQRLEPLGPDSKDSHAAVGKQVTLTSASPTSEQLGLVNTFLSLADKGAVGMVVKGRQGGQARGYTYVGNGLFQSDRALEVVSALVLQTRAGPGSELTYTVVPKGSERRIGIDRDEDGALDRDELDAGTRPDEPSSTRPPLR